MEFWPNSRRPTHFLSDVRFFTQGCLVAALIPNSSILPVARNYVGSVHVGPVNGIRPRPIEHCELVVAFLSDFAQGFTNAR